MPKVASYKPSTTMISVINKLVTYHESLGTHTRTREAQLASLDFRAGLRLLKIVFAHYVVSYEQALAIESEWKGSLAETAFEENFIKFLEGYPVSYGIVGRYLSLYENLELTVEQVRADFSERRPTTKAWWIDQVVAKEAPAIARRVWVEAALGGRERACIEVLWMICRFGGSYSPEIPERVATAIRHLGPIRSPVLSPSTVAVSHSLGHYGHRSVRRFSVSSLD